MLAHKAHCAGVKVVPVVAQVFHADHAFHRHFGQFHKDAKVRHARHNAAEMLAHAGQQGKAAQAAVHLAFAGHGRPLAPVQLVCYAQKLLTGGHRPGVQPQRRFERPVGEQVGIAADGRGKVAIRHGCQPEVPLVDGHVARLGHGPQAEAVDQEFLRRALNSGQYALHGGRRGPGRQVFKTRGLQRVKKAFKPFGVWLWVYAVEKGNVRITQVTGHGLVGRDHEFFDEAVGVVPQAVTKPGHAAKVVQAAFRFGQVKVQRAALTAHAAQYGVKRKGLVQHGQHFFAALLRLEVGEGGGVLVQQAGLDLIIGQARRRAHDSLRKARLARLTLGGKGNFCQHGQPVHVGAQAAQAVGQNFGQHGLHGAGKIPGIAARKGFGVKRAGAAAPARAHIMAHVGNGHAQNPALASGLLLHMDGVVKVPGVSAVNGHQREMAHVLSALEVGLFRFSGQGLGLGQNSGGKVAGHFVVELDQLFLHGHVVFAPVVAQKAGAPEIRGQRLDGSQQYEGSLSRGWRAFGQFHIEVGGQAAVCRAAKDGFAVAADHVRGHFLEAAFKYLKDAPFSRRPAWCAGGKGHAHHILVPRAAVLGGGDVDVLVSGKLPARVAQVVSIGKAHGRHKARALAQGAEAAGNGFQAFGPYPQPPAQPQRTALLFKVFQRGFQFFSVAAGKPQNA